MAEPRDVDFVYADLSRAGLGNLLFPWARAVLAARDTGATLLPPKWFKIRVGPYLRGETDKREYWRLFRRPTVSDLVQRAYVLTTATRYGDDGGLRRRGGRAAVRIFESMDEHFAPLGGERAFLGRELRRIARPGVILTQPPEPDFVAMHVRLGDFLPAPGSEPADRLINTRTPTAWFVDAVRWLRGHGWTGPVLLFSDGRDEELAPLTAEPGVRRHTSRNPLDDLVQMSRARALIGSGSSFSAWAAYLGGMPMAVQAGRRPFLPESPLLSEVATWASADAAELARAVSRTAVQDAS